LVYLHSLAQNRTKEDKSKETIVRRTKGGGECTDSRTKEGNRGPNEEIRKLLEAPTADQRTETPKITPGGDQRAGNRTGERAEKRDNRSEGDRKGQRGRQVSHRYSRLQKRSTPVKRVDPNRNDKRREEEEG